MTDTPPLCSLLQEVLVRKLTIFLFWPVHPAAHKGYVRALAKEHLGPSRRAFPSRVRLDVVWDED